jgi:hypothetical protein
MTVQIDPDDGAAPNCAPDGQRCAQCNGTHNPQPGVTFTTGRNWWTTDPDTAPQTDADQT